MSMETTKSKILAAARSLFVENGFAGTSMGNIAKLAAVNHSLIFHHFKNKEQLWLSVKQDIVNEATRQIATLPDHDIPFDEFLREVFRRNLRFYQDSPDIVRMINWQRLEKDSAQAIGVTNSGDMTNWIQAFRYYQSRGDIQSSLKPEWIVTLILSIISSAALDPNVFIAGDQMDGYMAFCMEAVLKVLQ